MPRPQNHKTKTTVAHYSGSELNHRFGCWTRCCPSLNQSPKQQKKLKGAKKLQVSWWYQLIYPTNSLLNDPCIKYTVDITEKLLPWQPAVVKGHVLSPRYDSHREITVNWSLQPGSSVTKLSGNRLCGHMLTQRHSFSLLLSVSAATQTHLNEEAYIINLTYFNILVYVWIDSQIIYSKILKFI